MDPLISTDQLRSFVTIAEMGSYTRAAERLYKTQPALSLQMRRLEEQLGIQVFQREGGQMTVTEAGQVLLFYAQRILNLNEEVINKLSVTETEGFVRIGILEEVAIGPLVDLLTKFGRLCTKINVELQVATSWELAKKIRENRLCLAVANSHYATQTVTPLWQEPYVWAANASEDLLDRDPLPLILDTPDCQCAVRDIALEMLNREGRRWTTVFSSLSLVAIQAAVRAGLGIGLIAKSALTPDMVVLGPQQGLPDIPLANIALYRSTEATSEAVQCLADFLITHLHPTLP